MSGDFTIYFEGSADSYARKCIFSNETGSSAAIVGLSSRTAQFPVTWSNLGQIEETDDSRTPSLTKMDGKDTEVIQFYFSYFFSGSKVIFNGIDLDFTGDTNSGVKIGALVGSRVTAFFEDGYQGFGELQMVDGKLAAIVSKP